MCGKQSAPSARVTRASCLAGSPVEVAIYPTGLLRVSAGPHVLEEQLLFRDDEFLTLRTHFWNPPSEWAKHAFVVMLDVRSGPATPPRGEVVMPSPSPASSDASSPPLTLSDAARGAAVSAAAVLAACGWTNTAEWLFPRSKPD